MAESAPSPTPSPAPPTPSIGLRARIKASILTWFGEPQKVLARGLLPGTRIPLKTRIALEIMLFARAIWNGDVTGKAAATAYTFVFSLIPLLASVLAFFTAFPGLSDQRDSLKQTIYSSLLPGAAREVSVYLDQFAEAAAAAGAVSTLVFLVSILLLFQSVEGTYNEIWKVTRARTWGHRLQVLAVFFLSGAVGVTLMVVLGSEAEKLSQQVAATQLSGVWVTLTQIGYEVANIAVAWAIFAVATWVLPATKVQIPAALISGVVMGSFWQLLKGGFTWYIENVAGYANIYGAVGTVPIFLLWLYLSIVLLLSSAHFAFVHQHLRALVNEHPLGKQGTKTLGFHAVAVAMGLADAFRQRLGPLATPHISERLKLNEYCVREALDGLHAHKLILCLPEECEKWMLRVPAEQLTVAEVLHTVATESLQSPTGTEPSPQDDQIRAVFSTARERLAEVLETVTIAELLDRASQPEAAPPPGPV